MLQCSEHGSTVSIIKEINLIHALQMQSTSLLGTKSQNQCLKLSSNSLTTNQTSNVIVDWVWPCTLSRERLQIWQMDQHTRPLYNNQYEHPHDITSYFFSGCIWDLHTNPISNVSASSLRRSNNFHYHSSPHSIIPSYWVIGLNARELGFAQAITSEKFLLFILWENLMLWDLNR